MNEDLQGAVHLEDEEQPRGAGPAVQLPLLGHRAVFDGGPDQRQHLLPQGVQSPEEPVVCDVKGVVGVDEQQDVTHGEHVEQVEAVLPLEALPEVVGVRVSGRGPQRQAGPQQLTAVADGGEQEVQHPVLLVVESLDVAARGAAVLRPAEHGEQVLVRQRVDQRLLQRTGLHAAFPEDTDHTQPVVPVSSVLPRLRLQQVPHTDGKNHVCLLHVENQGNENNRVPVPPAFPVPCTKMSEQGKHQR